MKKTSLPSKTGKKTPVRRQKANIQVVTEQHISQFSGPIPPPETLQQYEYIVSGAADRIIKMAEDQAVHRHAVESAIVTGEYTEAKRGQFCALLIGSLAIVAGVYAAIEGAQWPGAIIGGGGVIGLVSVFILGRRRREKD